MKSGDEKSMVVESKEKLTVRVDVKKKKKKTDS